MKKTMEILTVSMFCGFLTIMGMLYFLLPETDFSQKEKRYLEEKPDFTGENLLSGTWGENWESYLADHMPGRDFFVGLHAYFENITGRQNTKEIWQDGDCLMEAPLIPDEKRTEKNLGALQALAEKTDCPMDLMLIPSAGCYHDFPQYKDREILSDIYARAGEQLRIVDLLPVLDRDCYYRTDHHWTSGGAYLGYRAYVSSLGIAPRESFTRETATGFQGSAYSRSGLWLTPGEDLELWQGSENLTAEIGEETHEGIFFRENLQKPDKYTVFLGGNHPLVRIHNPSQKGKLLVIRDSFSNCLGGFLAESFGEVVMVDLRYYKQPVSAIMAEEDFDRVLVCYGLHNFLTDQNLILLKR